MSEKHVHGHSRAMEILAIGLLAAAMAVRGDIFTAAPSIIEDEACPGHKITFSIIPKLLKMFWHIFMTLCINPFLFIKNKLLFISSEGFSTLQKNTLICYQRAMVPIQLGVTALCR
jgi:hypothetical protein